MTRQIDANGFCTRFDRPSARANPAALIVLLVVMVAGLSGILGGYAPRHYKSESADIILNVRTPDTLRNGMVFEMLIEVEARKPVKALVIGISHELWRNMTINTALPSGEKEESRNGFYRFSFSELRPGHTFTFKIDGQINPSLRNNAYGTVRIYDGDRSLANIAIHTKVLP